MAQKTLASEELSFRPAKSMDATFAGRMLFDSFPRKATFILGLGDVKRAKEVLTKLFPLTDHRLSFNHAHIAMIQGRNVGIMITFPGGEIGRLNRKLYRLILSQYTFRGKIALFQRGLPMVFIKECASDEYFLSNIVVKAQARGKGLGSRMLGMVEEQARQAGYKKVSLRVAIDNLDAKRFYQRHYYKTKAIDLESNQRVSALGPGYLSMEKVLNETEL
jgi:ribosomal protein S18 acetylase RimI-like enzyme